MNNIMMDHGEYYGLHRMILGLGAKEDAMSRGTRNHRKNITVRFQRRLASRPEERMTTILVNEEVAWHD